MHDVKLEHRQGLLTMENSCILRQFSTDGAFVPRSFFLKTMSCELLAATQYWFELIVNGQQVSSGTYLSHDFRNMKHRGLEVTIRFVVPVVSFSVSASDVSGFAHHPRKIDDIPKHGLFLSELFEWETTFHFSAILAAFACATRRGGNSPGHLEC